MYLYPQHIKGGKEKRKEGKASFFQKASLPPPQPPVLSRMLLCANAVSACSFSSPAQLPSPLQLGFSPSVLSKSGKCNSLLSALSCLSQLAWQAAPSRISPLQLSGSSFAFLPSSLFQITKPVDMLAESTLGFPRNNHFVWGWSRSTATDCSIPGRKAVCIVVSRVELSEIQPTQQNCAASAQREKF